MKAALVLVGLLFASFAGAQTWPAKPIRVIVNFAPGGAPDVVARLYAPALSEALGQAVIIENRPGAGGNIGLEAVVRSAPDGYSFLSSASSSLVIGPHLYKLTFDVAKDVMPVVPMALTPMFLVVRPGLPVASVAELIAYAHANPGKLNYGSAGNGTLPHVTGEMLLRAADIQATHVPFNGSGPALAALLGEQIDFLFDPGVALPQVKAGKVRLLAVASAARSAEFPETPTMAEAGTDVNAASIVGLYAPAGTPREIVARINREVMWLMQTAKVRDALGALAAQPFGASPEEFAALLRRDRERFGEVVRAANIRID
jgi:tripartite-type tricarboxylate transporter receptor subunit TctC